MTTLEDVAKVIHKANPEAKYFYLGFHPWNGYIFIDFYSEGGRCEWNEGDGWYIDENTEEEVHHPFGWFGWIERLVGNMKIPNDFDLTPYEVDEPYKYYFKTAEYIIEEN